jgi:ketosteroid isomerase-like protein
MQRNVEALEELTAAMNRRDVEAVLRGVAVDVVFRPARSDVEGAYLGHDGIRVFFANNAENFELFRIDFRELRDLGEWVLATGSIHIRGRGGGVEMDIPTAGLASFESGRMTRWEDFRERRLALRAAGIQEPA